MCSSLPQARTTTTIGGRELSMAELLSSHRITLKRCGFIVIFWSLQTQYFFISDSTPAYAPPHAPPFNAAMRHIYSDKNPNDFQQPPPMQSYNSAPAAPGYQPQPQPPTTVILQQEDPKKKSKFGKIGGTVGNAAAGGLGFGAGAGERLPDFCMLAGMRLIICYAQLSEVASSTVFSKLVVSGSLHHSRISTDYFTHYIPFISAMSHPLTIVLVPKHRFTLALVMFYSVEEHRSFSARHLIPASCRVVSSTQRNHLSTF